MEELIIKLLNEYLAHHLPSINHELDNEIKTHNLDPLKHVTSGRVNLGTLHVGIANATTVADYSVTNLTGLSSATLDHVVLSAHHPEMNEAGNLTVGFMLDGHLASPLNTDYTAKLSAKAGPIHEHANVHGMVGFNGVHLHATGTVTAHIEPSTNEICVKDVHVDEMNATYSKVNITIEGLGVFAPLKNVIITKLKDIVQQEVKKLGSQTVRNMVNKAIAKIDFPCVHLPI